MKGRSKGTESGCEAIGCFTEQVVMKSDHRDKIAAGPRGCFHCSARNAHLPEF